MTDAASSDLRAQVDALYKTESRAVLSTLIRLLGDFELAEEALHDAFTAALTSWPVDGAPANPRAWLISTGRFKATGNTLIGCTGLVVEVTGASGQAPVTVAVTAPDGSTRSATCSSATGTCPVSFPDFTPASVTIRVVTGTQTTEETRQPTYAATRPNGPACPPECRNARVTVAL